jgi:acyl-CoA synthetase (AMP-forming)/AMP-acid ligase II
VIVSGGENVYCAVVEQALCTHPAIAEAAVVGVPDGRWGATVVLHPRAAVTAGELVAFCHERLGGVARPRSVEFRSELPRTRIGKVHKRALREPFWARQDRRVAGV